uniref:TonB-dependent receptor plug domain-containing protein n=1 Tax=Flavobacterium sp. TaxID=239 RepID=UPI0040494FC1
MKIIILFLTFFVFNFSFTQVRLDSINTTPLEEVIVSTKKTIKQREFIPSQIETISLKQIEFQNFQNMADLLSSSGNLHVQKSQQGGGSPSIRGFEASRVLLLVDGIRMNNLIFRAGHLQNAITVDENLLENVDIFFGPSSTLFGSDALGGSINMSTKKAKFLDEIEDKISGNTNTRYSSVNEEKSIHFDLNFATKNFAALTAISYNDFGDLRMGKRKNRNGNFFGERPFYVTTNADGTDALTQNNNKYIQKNSGYTQYNLMQKFAYKTTKGIEHEINFQYSTTNNVPRYDRLTDETTSGLRNAEWFYGPQKRLLAIYSLNKEKAVLDSDLSIDISYQNVEESRNSRRFGEVNLERNYEEVNMFSLGVNLHKKLTKGELFYGYESYFELLKSTAENENIITGQTSSDLQTRYPNGDNNMSRNDLYISYNEKRNEKTAWNLGARIGYTTLKSSIKDDTLFPLPFNNVTQTNFTYSATAGLIYKPSKNVDLKTNISTGFRVPNIDDLAKVFDSGNDILIVPNADLKPEKTITTDFGFIIKSNNKRFQVETTYYYTQMYDAIITDNFTYQGQNTILYNGEESNVFANQNKGKAFVTGISSNIKTYIFNTLQFHGNFNYTLGRIIEENNTRSPLDHIAPYYGRVSLLFTKKWAILEAYLLYNGKKDISDYYPNGEDNERYAPEGGMPAWETYNFKTSFKILKGTTLFTGIENILDTQYRVFASGINAPGRNIYGGLKYSF